MGLFTKEELAELARADAQVEETFRLTAEDIRRSRELDRAADLERKDVNRQRGATYYQRNKAEISRSMAAYYQANRKKILARTAAYYQAHKEERAAYAREWYRNNREKVLAQQASYYQANREKISAKRAESYRAKKGRGNVPVASSPAAEAAPSPEGRALG